MPERKYPQLKPDPTPEEIKQRCLEIQATWSKEIRSSRRVRSYDFIPVRSQTSIKKVIKLSKQGFNTKGIMRDTGYSRKDILAILRGDYTVYGIKVQLNPYAFTKTTIERRINDIKKKP